MYATTSGLFLMRSNPPRSLKTNLPIVQLAPLLQLSLPYYNPSQIPSLFIPMSISYAFSKAFDSLSHSALFSKLSKVDIPDNIYNWIVHYFSERTHITSLSGNSSQPIAINASIVQGSVLGPTLFNINSSDLSPISPSNHYFKYADDAYLLVPASNSSTIPSEILHHQTWASSCNFKNFNPSKTSEIVFKRPRTPYPRLISGILSPFHVKTTETL